MKSLIVLCLLLVTSNVFAQTTPLPEWIHRNKTLQKTSWDSVFVTGKSFQPSWAIIVYDSGASDLIVARQDDTTSTKWVRIKRSDTPVTIPSNYAKWFKWRADTAAVRARMTIF